MELLINQVGYDCDGHKIALLQTAADVEISGLVRLRRLHDDRLLLEVPLQAAGQVPGWQGRAYWRADFSAFKESGHYRLEAITAQGIVRSTRFAIGQDLLIGRCLSDVIHYFKGQRASGAFDRADRSARLFGTDRHKDVHGGWFDASGDMSKYLSHLSYANYLNPQQTPLVVWSLLKSRALLATRHDIDGLNLCKRLSDEGLHGADFLCRMQDEAGFFYMTLFDKWSKDPEQRELCAYATQQGLKSNDWQAGFRQGGGMAIAALARAAREQTGGDFDTSHYAEAARRGYLHLREHNLAYLDDGLENIIDDYCALLAAVELTQTLGHDWLGEARERAGRLCARQRPHPELGHYWSANDDGSRPYYHAAEAGLPVLALLEYLGVEPDQERRARVNAVVQQALAAELALAARAGNPLPGPPICEGGGRRPPHQLLYAPPQRVRLLVAGGERPAGLPGRHGLRRGPPLPSAAPTPDDVRPAPARLDPRAKPLQRLHAGGARHQQPELHRRLSQCAGGDLQRHHRRVR